ncbi:hypothetical protein MARA_55090 [Mycolicibacterium arabiense]|uniref:PE family protein n=1 Tax=Mycolicibacterium arabiense TaxID=1286181 RepID=A0A7I7S6M8_9MYCO|nr:hypothetical protein [Mycolicibacterium arabiense]MCV7372784.1 hypothetical protein [Mycolicibacterium arabiense]BBY52041.1 hypothetical protein MARA_55090 [Mycolicibacterium arabiense]
MIGDLRSQLAAGMAALAVSAVALSTVAVPVRDTGPDAVTRSVDLASSVRPIVLEPLRPDRVAVARDAIERLDPEAAALIPAPPADPVPLNAASDGINAAYQWLQGWVNYGVELTQYVLQFIPYGYLIGDQVGIVYYDLVVPIADSVVYDLIDPVVNDPLNIWSYVNGIGAVAATTVASFINLGIAELNYFLGWLIPPIPPIPFATTETTEVAEMSLTTAAEEPAESLEPVDAPAEEPAAPAVSPAAETEPETTTEPETNTDSTTGTDIEPAVEDAPTTTTSGTVQAQGEVRGSVTDPTDPKDPTSSTDTDATTTGDENTGDETTDPGDEQAGQPAAPDAAAPDAPDAKDAPDAANDADD